MAEWSSKKRGLPDWARPEILEERDQRKRARYREMTPRERARELSSVCRTAAVLASSRPDKGKVPPTPIPERSRRLWERLRRGYRWHAPER